MRHRSQIVGFSSILAIFGVSCLFQNCTGYSAGPAITVPMSVNAISVSPTSVSPSGTDPGATPGEAAPPPSQTNGLTLALTPDATVFTARSLVSLQASGGTPPYQIRVNGSAITGSQFTTPSAAGTSQIEVRDATGRTGTLQIRNTDQAVTTSSYYNGGSIMLGRVRAYVIWYGDWSYNTEAKDIVENYLANLGGSDYYSVVTTYFGSQGGYASDQLSFVKSVSVDSTKYGTSLTNGSIQQIVADKINDGTFPADENGIFAVMMNKNVDIVLGGKKFCSQGGLSGGYHQNFKMSSNGKMIKYAMVGDVTGKYCSQLLSSSTERSPNNNPSADFMSSVLGHELTEVVTNPLDYRAPSSPAPTAWDAQNEGTGEIGDLCAGYNGVPKTLVQLGNRSYWLQQLMVVKGNSADHCSDSINR